MRSIIAGTKSARYGWTFVPVRPPDDLSRSGLIGPRILTRSLGRRHSPARLASRDPSGDACGGQSPRLDVVAHRHTSADFLAGLCQASPILHITATAFPTTDGYTPLESQAVSLGRRGAFPSIRLREALMGLGRGADGPGSNVRQLLAACFTGAFGLGGSGSSVTRLRAS